MGGAGLEICIGKPSAYSCSVVPWTARGRQGTDTEENPRLSPKTPKV